MTFKQLQAIGARLQTMAETLAISNGYWNLQPLLGPWTFIGRYSVTIPDGLVNSQSHSLLPSQGTKPYYTDSMYHEERPVTTMKHQLVTCGLRLQLGDSHQFIRYSLLFYGLQCSIDSVTNLIIATYTYTAGLTCGVLWQELDSYAKDSNETGSVMSATS